MCQNERRQRQTENANKQKDTHSSHLTYPGKRILRRYPYEQSRLNKSMKFSFVVPFVASSVMLMTDGVDAFSPPCRQTKHQSTQLAASASNFGQNENAFLSNVQKISSSVVLVATLSFGMPLMALAGEGAEVAANAKITTGGASTLQSGRTIAITRGVNLDRSDFSGQNLKGVAFQQSIVRDTNFKGANLYGASFFDATLDGSNFEDADLTLANVEMAQFNRANLKNAVMKEMYVSGSTLFEGVASIENSDWSETMLRRDQQKYLCNHPTAKGTNPVTGMDTRESLMCPE